MNTEKDILLRRIANHLILHSIDIEDICRGTARRNLREYSRDIAYKSGDWIMWNRLGNRISNSKWVHGRGFQ